ncbi:MAG: hypothetical protein AAB967_02100 [Patescibacteria group bacterium]
MSREENHQNPNQYHLTATERVAFLHRRFGRGNLVNTPQAEIDRAVREEEARLAEKLEEIESSFENGPEAS